MESATENPNTVNEIQESHVNEGNKKKLIIWSKKFKTIYF